MLLLFLLLLLNMYAIPIEWFFQHVILVLSFLVIIFEALCSDHFFFFFYTCMLWIVLSACPCFVVLCFLFIIFEALCSN